CGIGLRERPAKNCKILRENKRQAAFNSAIAGDKAVAVDLLRGCTHSEVSAAVRDHLVEFLKRTLVKKEFNPFTGRHFAFLMLACATLFTAARLGQAVSALQFCEFLLQVHTGRIIAVTNVPSRCAAQHCRPEGSPGEVWTALKIRRC